MLKILFAIQGTGNGHLSRARDVYPELCKFGEVDVLISGIQADVDFPFPVKYRYYGMSFIFGKKGGVDIWLTAKRLNLIKLIKDIWDLPVNDYDLVVNDFEPVSSWACKLKKKACIGLSHQSAVLHKDAPKPKQGDLKGELVLKYYAPVTASYGFHFKAYPPNVFTPVIRNQIREITPVNNGHYTVYLPAYDDANLVKHLSAFPDTKWEVFSKHNKTPFADKNISVQPINNDAFIESMATSTGVLCGAGFEGPAEALFLGKKLLAIPMKEQYEQQCNAAGLEEIGVPVIKELNARYYTQIEEWIKSEELIYVNYPDQTSGIIAQLIQEHTGYAHETSIVLADA
jgi:uncharacterized protein (TIGR00661 family)